MVRAFPSSASVPAPLLVLGGVVSVQFGGALAATLVPEIGAGGSVLLRVGIAAVILFAVARPRLRGHDRKAWTTAVAFGVALGLMNWSFYSSLARLPLGVAVTVEFLGPLVLTMVLSRRVLDFVAVIAAGIGVLLISEALTAPLGDLSWVGLGLAATAGVCWAAYILLSGLTGAAFPALDGLAIALVVSTVVVLPVGLLSDDLWTTEHVL
ncbi:MAG: EamA family transporter, partial [Marmoricola sp.]